MNVDKTQILIYSGSGADCVNDLVTSLEEHLDTHIIAITTFENSPPDLRKKEVALLVIPGGDLFLTLNGLKSSAASIKKFVSENSYLGIGSGAILASNRFYLHEMDEGSVSLTDLNLFYLFQGAVISPRFCQDLNPSSVYNEETPNIQWHKIDSKEVLSLKMYHHREPCFFPAAGTEIVAAYKEELPIYADNIPGGAVFNLNEKTSPAAVVECRNPLTKAKSILCGVHPEFIPEENYSKYFDKDQHKHHKRIIDTLSEYETARKECMRDILRRLGFINN